MLRALVNESVLLLSFFAYAFTSTVSDKCCFNFGPWSLEGELLIQNYVTYLFLFL